MIVFKPYKIDIEKLYPRPYSPRRAAQWEAFQTSIGIVFCSADAGPMIVRDGRLGFLFEKGIERKFS